MVKKGKKEKRKKKREKERGKKRGKVLDVEKVCKRENGGKGGTRTKKGEKGGKKIRWKREKEIWELGENKDVRGKGRKGEGGKKKRGRRG